MTVYVDTMKSPYRRMIMSHMVADTTEELLDMADKIGVQRKWLQKPGTPHEHFDVCQTKRAKAIANGAEEISRAQLGRILRWKREGTMIRYVVVYAFDDALTRVVLLKKRTGPAALIGKWNGVGGKIDPGELPSEAAYREFREETGVEVGFLLRTDHGYDFDAGWELHTFFALGPVDEVRTMEHEEVRVFPVDALPADIMPDSFEIISRVSGNARVVKLVDAPA